VIAADRLGRAFLELHPQRAAVTLGEMPATRAAAVLGAVPARAAATVLRDMTVPDASDCLEHLAAAQAAAIIAEMAAGDAANLVRALKPELREHLITALPAELRDPIARLLRYPEGTAGAVMDPAIFQLPDHVLVADARVRLGRAARGLLYYLYIVDRERRLVGVLDIPELMSAPERDPVSAVMHRNVERFSAWTPAALVRRHPGWLRYHAMPVVDVDERLLGAIRYQTLRKLEREASDRGRDPTLLTANALAELFRLGTSGLVAGVAATASAPPDPDRPVSTQGEAPDAR
jgi:magnesium transporter